jgi:Kef-type K+ transport system membrane component KefB
VIHALIVLFAVAGLMHAARSFLPSDADGHAISGTALSFGFLLLGAFFAGKIFAAARLPRLTGYIVAGIVAGPSVAALVSRDMVRALGPVQGVAICLIALTAGGELNVRRMRPLFRTIGWMTLYVVVGCATGITAALLLMMPWLPFLEGVGLWESVVVCSVIGVSLAALSPAVVMALLSEMRAEGPLSRTMLGVVVAADLVVIVLFSLIASGAQAVLGESSAAADVARHVGWELGGSALAGIAMGIVLTVYLRKVRAGRALFVLLGCVLMSEVGSRLALDPLIIALTAGLFMENFSEVETTTLVTEIEAASLPVYVVFFAVAGAALRVDLLSAVLGPAAMLVGVRFVLIWLGSLAGARRAHADATVKRWAFTGFLPQAGLALALPLLYPSVLPGIAEGPAALVLGIVGINQVLMPILLRIALVRSGESSTAGGQSEQEGLAQPPRQPA